jgi:hypothetical protein
MTGRLLVRRLLRSSDIAVLAVVLCALSVPLLASGRPPLRLVYSPGAVRSDEWWRLLAHPFIRVSRYHLLLDGAAFLALLWGLAASLVPGETPTGSATSAAWSAAPWPRSRSAHGLGGPSLSLSPELGLAVGARADLQVPMALLSSLFRGSQTKRRGRTRCTTRP